MAELLEEIKGDSEEKVTEVMKNAKSIVAEETKEKKRPYTRKKTAKILPAQVEVDLEKKKETMETLPVQAEVSLPMHLEEENKKTQGAFLSNLYRENNELKERMKHMVEMDLTYQWYIPQPPVNKTQLYGQACANDGITVRSWVDIWLRQIEENLKYNFHKNSVISEAKKAYMKPVIIAGSGPSLKKNAHYLRDKQEITLVSCLHNFHYFVDNDIHPEYYLNLDADSEITIREVTEGGKQDPEYYWDKTKNYTLLTATHCSPELHKKWKGKILWFASVIADPLAMEKAQKMTNDFKVYFQVGGNALGACLYMARAILGGCPIAFVGADFSFSYNKKFHSWDSPYDKQFSGVVPCTDVFGNRVYTWQSYYNFKCWMEYQAMGGDGGNPQMFINCTEGGILGAYNDGNMIQIQQMGLEWFIKMYTIPKYLDGCIEKRMLLF
jgi:hypothetical protein